jgi:hypothetical protein
MCKRTKPESIEGSGTEAALSVGGQGRRGLLSGDEAGEPTTRFIFLSF